MLSGPFAVAGEGSLKQLREVVLQLNAKSAAGDPKFEVVPFDGKGTPQESLTALKSATDQGIRYVTQGGGSGVAFALSEALAKLAVFCGSKLGGRPFERWNASIAASSCGPCWPSISPM